MKILLTTLSFVILALCACKPGQTNQEEVQAEIVFDETAEIAAIMKVIENETKCFFDGNYECWANNWSHEDYTFQGWNNSDGSTDAAIGWEKINKQGKEWIEKYYKNGEKVIHPIVKKEKPLVKFFNEQTAYLIWKQYNGDQDKKFYRISQETRLMEKQSDGWKIVNVTALWDTEAKISIDSIPL